MPKHQYLSWGKSAIRIAGYVLLLVTPLTAIVLLVASEVIGIVEEIGHE